MSDFRQLSETFWASPQISVDDVAAAGTLGFSLIINNRPDGESADQVGSEAIAEAANAAGIAYCAIPITHAGFSEPQVAALVDALKANPGKALGYCRSGTRSTLLWALARASIGESPDDLTRQAAAAGYDLAPIRHAMDMLAARASG